MILIKTHCNINRLLPINLDESQLIIIDAYDLVIENWLKNYDQ